jgi:type IV pilus assembly protein PilC
VVLGILENWKLIPVFSESRAPGGAAAVRGRIARRYAEMAQKWRTSVPPVAVALFARQLSTMISAGLPLVRSLRSIARDHEDKKLAAILERVADDVQKGESLSNALVKHPGAFNVVFVSLVNTGEVSGTLDRIMDQTAGYLERAERLRLKVQAALRYPIFVLTFAFLILIVMIVKIIPMFAGIYARFRVPLPLPTQILLAMSQAVVNNLLLSSGLCIVATTAFWLWTQQESGKFRVDQAKFNLPLFGPLIRMYAVTKFARTLGILTASGTPKFSMRSRSSARCPATRYWNAESSTFAPGSRRVIRSQGHDGVGVFPEMLVQMTATGEETGQLDNMLSRTADYRATRGRSSRRPGFARGAIAIVVLGGLVGVMLLALYLPIFSLDQAMRSGLLGH